MLYFFPRRLPRVFHPSLKTIKYIYIYIQKYKMIVYHRMKLSIDDLVLYTFVYYVGSPNPLTCVMSIIWYDTLDGARGDIRI